MDRKYRRPSDLGIVTSYFNPCRFKTRAANFERYVEPILEAGIPLVVIEACFDEPTLPVRYDSLKVKARDVMWQKERLLDLGTGWLPSSCTKVAWIDADVLFENEDWALETSAGLDTQAVLQPFETVVRLSRGTETPLATDDAFESFGAVYTNRRFELMYGKFERHGHTGFAWAIRRDIVAKHGFYDACIAGSGDHMMAHSFANDWDSPCVARMVGRGGKHLSHYRKWSQRLNEDVGGRVGYVPGRLLHLWHGTIENRRYAQRNRELLALSFDPKSDIRISDTGCWEWASDKPALHEWAVRYFEERREDDDTL